jgi:hypothetical protein
MLESGCGTSTVFCVVLQTMNLLVSSCAHAELPHTAGEYACIACCIRFRLCFGLCVRCGACHVCHARCREQMQRIHTATVTYATAVWHGWPSSTGAAYERLENDAAGTSGPGDV